MRKVNPKPTYEVTIPSQDRVTTYSQNQVAEYKVNILQNIIYVTTVNGDTYKHKIDGRTKIRSIAEDLAAAIKATDTDTDKQTKE